MTPEQKGLVESSFALAGVMPDRVASTFYTRLFETAPELRPMFKEDMDAQGRKLVAMLGTAVAHIHDLTSIMDAIHDLGRRHVAYGVREEHYESVGQALIWTLEDLFGDDFTPELRDAWSACYAAIAGQMQRAAAVSRS